MRGAVLRDGTRDTGCGLKAFRRELFLALPYFDGLHRFLPALVRREGYDIGYVDVVDRPRRHGVSNYGLWDRLWVGILDLAGVWWLIRRKQARAGNLGGARMLVDLSHAVGGYLHDVFVASLDWWVLLGFVAQAMFTMRFRGAVDRLRARRPAAWCRSAFWLFSIGGGLLLLVYALYRTDPVFIVGQAFGVFVYLRNLYFVMRDRKAAAAAACVRRLVSLRCGGQRRKAALEIGDQVARRLRARCGSAPSGRPAPSSSRCASARSRTASPGSRSRPRTRRCRTARASSRKA